MEDLKTAIEKCKTVNQVYKVLAKYNRTFIKDDSVEFGVGFLFGLMIKQGYISQRG